MTKQSVLLTGANGQLGQTIQEIWCGPGSTNSDLVCTDIEELDITNPAAITDFLTGKSISTIINAAAYTAVDKAESEPDKAYAINELGTKNLAIWSNANQSRLIQVSTDFVFNGSGTKPYSPDDTPAPLSVYGKSKLAGEQAARSVNPRSVIVRTSWLYSPFQSNFVKTMLKLMSEREELNVVNDQFGAPTSTIPLAELLVLLVNSTVSSGIYHWSDSANISWYDFALEIQKQGIAAGLLDRKIAINPISTDLYPTAAERPKFSVLNTESTTAEFGLEPQDWKTSLAKVVARI